MQKQELLQKPNQKPVQNKMITHELDANGQILGRLATQVAVLLRGKNKSNFRPNMLVGDKVKIINAAKIVVTGNKMEQKMYYRHSGYLGNLKSFKLKEIMVKDPTEVLRKAIYGMLPANKLRRVWMKNLEITK